MCTDISCSQISSCICTLLKYTKQIQPYAINRAIWLMLAIHNPIQSLAIQSFPLPDWQVSLTMDHSGAAMFVYFHQHQPRSDHHHDQHHQSHQHPIPQLSTWSRLMTQIPKLSQITLPWFTAMSDVILSCHTSLQLVNLGTSFQCIMYTSQCSHQSIQTSQLHWV